jgi:hypothetical protein
MEITIKGQLYPLRFGLKFVKEVNGREMAPVDGLIGVEQGIGLNLMIANIIDGSIEDLASAIMTANKTEEPRIKEDDLLEFLEDDATNIDEVFEKVLGFFEKANCTRKMFKNVQKSVETAQKLQEAELKARLEGQN